VDEVLRVVETRLKDKPAAVKIRFDNDRTKPDINIPGDIAKARAVRQLVGEGFPLAFDANNCYSVGARSAPGVFWKSSATGGSRSRCSTTM
jgi:L-alanine-DL-glutamate epimerase-like enolase superfamily enzyme